MLQEAYARLSSLAERHVDPIIATAFENWPPLYQDHAVTRPLVSLPLGAEDIEVILRGNSDRAHWKRQAVAIANIGRQRIDLQPGRVFPKIGPVSWKEVPAFRAIESDEVATLLPALLSSVTSRMAIILEAFVIGQVPTFLHLFPALDLSSFAEVRVTVRNGRPVEARWQMIPDGVHPDTAMKENIMEVVTLLCEESPLPRFLIDLCLDCRRVNAPAKLIEINPDISMPAGPNGQSAHL